ncbi:hypothetical protein ZWY2020_026376 [Hordeum vulgare]|nr:hypothetical protein ZWY2020_026376 [Hordeum vulgare]
MSMAMIKKMEFGDNILEQIMDGELLLEDLPPFICKPLSVHPWTIIFLLSVYILNKESQELSQMLEYEDNLVEQLRSGQLTLEQLALQASQEDTDSDD